MPAKVRTVLRRNGVGDRRPDIGGAREYLTCAEWVYCSDIGGRHAPGAFCMNSCYFLCRDHGVYIDAGYRWAYWRLEHAGVVALGMSVDVPAVLDTTAFQNPSEADRSDYLDDLLPRIRDFLSRHAGHDLLYVDEDWLHEKWELGYDYREQYEPPIKP